MLSETFLENSNGLWGLFVAIVILIVLFFINRRVGRSKRLFDERYYLKANRAKARSWDAMLIIYLITWFVVIIFDGISFSFFLITALYVLHNITLIITTVYYAEKD